MPFSGVEWTYQARDLGFMEEIESDEEASDPQNNKGNHDEVEMADLSKTSSTIHKVHHLLPEVDSSLDSIMEDS